MGVCMCVYLLYICANDKMSKFERMVNIESFPFCCFFVFVEHTTFEFYYYYPKGTLLGIKVCIGTVL